MTDNDIKFALEFVEKNSKEKEVWVNADTASILSVCGHIDSSGLENEPKDSTLCGKTSYGTKVYIDMLAT
jgi:hypothetical protein